MDPDNVNHLLKLAISGNSQAREKLIAQHRPYILKEAQRVCRRYLEWGHDDELSIALMAFNEAIDVYREYENSSFEGLCRTVIKRRLIDYFRKVNKDEKFLTGSEDISHFAVEEDWERNEREAEINKYRQTLNDFNLDFDILVETQPKHKQTREKLQRAAMILARESELISYLKSSGRLPKRRLCEQAGITSRVLDRGRNYVVALALLLSSEELPLLREYAWDLTGKGAKLGEDSTGYRSKNQ